MQKAPSDQKPFREKLQEGTPQPLTPVEAVTADDGLDVVLIDERIAAADSVAIGTILTGTGNTDLIIKQNP